MDNKGKKLLPSSSRKKLLSIDEEHWKLAEERVQEILWTIQPNKLSEMNRKGVIDYVQRLIRSYYGPEAQVFTFGSVPLKTYLPDGDIDLTILSHEDSDEDLALEVKCIVGSGNDPEYQIEGPLHIPAQVHVVKCTVKHIAVDITFNQMAGIYALRFLEQVDKIVGKNHLFKRSIILIKAWCFYEGRILGAFFSLFSTYAVETLVLYIINRFHSSVRGPLEVLYKFLNYYSSFDWDHNYISIWGPGALSSLPEIVEIPECERGEFLLQKEFLRNYRDMCSYSAKASETTTHEFTIKPMNILDPLRNDNNLGLSICPASASRIKLAFSFGARKLRRILKLPGQNMGAELEMFFESTLERNGKGERADVNVPVPPFGTGRAEESVLCGDCDSYYGAIQFFHQCRKTVPPSSPLSPSQDDILALSMQQNWSEGDVLAQSTQQNWSEENDLAQSSQQNWSMYNQIGEAYIPGQSLYHPTYSLEEGGKSRGTGTYIPDSKYNYYRNLRAKTIKQRKNLYAKNNALLKSPLRNQQAKEAHSESEMNANSKSFELANEDSPNLPGIPQAITPPQVQESAPLAKVHSEIEMNANSKPFELANEDFPALPCIPKAITPPQVQESAPLAKVHSETDMDSEWKLFEISNEDFPFPPKVHSVTNLDGNSKSNELLSEDFPPLSKVSSVTEMASSSRSFELTDEDFPLLQSTHKIIASRSSQLTKQDKSSPSSELEENEFGTNKISQSLTELSLSTKDEEEASGVSLSEETVLAVQKVTMERNEESPESNEKMV